MANVRISGLHKRYGQVHAVRGVDLDIPDGEFTVLVGPSGCGKSTLLRTIAGIITPDRGRLTRAPVSCQLLSLALGFVPHLSGRDNAVLSGLMLGLRRRDIVGRLPAILEFSELGDFFDQPISSYSTGMLMRLGFSVAIQVEPDVLLIDEVLAVGDADFQQKSGAALRERIDSGTTVVFVSHGDAQIHQICDRVLWIDHGRSVMEGPVDDVLAAYHAALQAGTAVATP